MKILIEESVVQQALDALELSEPRGILRITHQRHDEAITALRTALEAPQTLGYFEEN